MVANLYGLEKKPGLESFENISITNLLVIL